MQNMQIQNMQFLICKYKNLNCYFLVHCISYYKFVMLRLLFEILMMQSVAKANEFV